jgi:hypothetical protein
MMPAGTQYTAVQTGAGIIVPFGFDNTAFCRKQCRCQLFSCGLTYAAGNSNHSGSPQATPPKISRNVKQVRLTQSY